MRHPESRRLVLQVTALTFFLGTLEIYFLTVFLKGELQTSSAVLFFFLALGTHTLWSNRNKVATRFSRFGLFSRSGNRSLLFLFLCYQLTLFFLIWLNVQFLVKLFHTFVVR